MGIASQSIYFYLIFRKKLFLVMTAKAGINFRRHSVLDTESSDFKKKVGGSPTPNHWPSASLRYSSSREAAELALLRQSSPKTPALIGLYPYWACPPSARCYTATLVSSAWQQGI